MLISICIPQYNRSRHLFAVLDSICRQDYPDIEVVISDDCSHDDTETAVPAYISRIAPDRGIRFRYIRQRQNLGYDANLRASLTAASGDYLFILGNDDALPAVTTLSDVAKVLGLLKNPDIVVGNYYQANCPDQVIHRVRSTMIVGTGPEVAVRWYRVFSFVGGIIINRSAFLSHNTDQYDGSVYVQMYLGARIIAAGGRLATIDKAIVAKDVMVGGIKANSYADVLKRDNARITPRMGGLDQVGRVVCDAILPHVQAAKKTIFLVSIYRRLLSYSYLYWLVQYRKDGVFRASLNLALGCMPTRLLRFRPVSWWGHVLVWLVYFPVTLAGLTTPLRLVDVVKRRVYRAPKAREAMVK